MPEQMRPSVKIALVTGGGRVPIHRPDRRDSIVSLMIQQLRD
jgi:hypothetical protein